MASRLEVSSFDEEAAQAPIAGASVVGAGWAAACKGDGSNGC